MEYRVKWVHGRPYASWILITMNVLWYLVIEGRTGRSPIGLVAAGALDYHDVVIGHQWWRLISADFVHMNLTHIGFNMIALAFVAAIEMLTGSWAFIIVYIVTGVIGNLAQVFLYAHNTVSAGASGAIMGLYGMALYLAITGTLSVAVRNQIIILFVVNLVYGFSTPHIGNGAHIGGFFSGLLLAGPILQAKRISFRRALNVAGVTITILSVASLSLAYNDIRYAENPLSILSRVATGNLPGLGSTSGQRFATGSTAATANHKAGSTSTGSQTTSSETPSNTTSGSSSSLASNPASNTTPASTVHRPDPVKEFKTKFNKTLKTYTKVRAEYKLYHSQYMKKAITEAEYYSAISGLVAPLDFDGTQLRYLKMIAPANAKKMTEKLNDSEKYFYGYMEILSYSLKTSHPAEAQKGLTYLTKSNKAFKDFQPLRQEYLKNN